MAPAAPPTPSGGLQGEVLQLMQNWGKQGHKAAGIKRVLNKINVSGVGAATPEQLAWLKWAFSPQADGSYNTPEYIESLT